MDDRLIEEKFKNIGEKITGCEDRLDNHNEMLCSLDKSMGIFVARTTDALEKLSEMPKIMSSMQTSILLLNQKSDELGLDVKNLKEDFNKINEEGKVNLREFIKKNWIGLVLALSGAAAWAAKFLGWNI